jgi:O-antigen/teichoic acid export membrane protein
MAAGITKLANVHWVGLSQLGRLVLQLASVAIFSRILAPAEFGILAMATVVMGLANLFQNMGTSAAVIQRGAPTKKLLDSVFWLNIWFSLAVGTAVVATSPFAATAFKEPRLQHVLLFSAMVFPATAMGSTHLALLERASRFRTIARIEISSAVIGLCVAVLATLLGCGVVSLIFQMLATSASSTVQFWIVSPWRPSGRWDAKEVYGLAGFSGNLVAFNIVNYLSNNVDSMLVGYFLGAANLGWYNMAFRIMLFPIQTVTKVFNRALLPIYSRQEFSGIGEAYLRMLSVLALICTPIVAGLWALRKPLVIVVLGDKWLPVADVLTWFGPLAWLECLASSTSLILVAIGRTDVLRNVGLFSSAMYMLSFICGVPFGIVGLAKFSLLAALISFLVTFYFVLKTIGLGMTDLVKSTWRIALIGAILGAAISVALNELGAAVTQPWLQLLMLVPSGAALFLALVALVLPDMFVQLSRIKQAALP